MPVSALPTAATGERQTPLSGVHSDLTLRHLSGRERFTLGAITLLALLVRAWLQRGRLFWGDEIGTLHYIKASPGYLLSHFKSHLTMNYFILAEKWIAWLFGATDWRLTLLPLAGAVATIPLTASLALKFTGSTRTALIAGALAAFNPFLIYWGPMIRSYSLLVAFSLLAINECFHWYQQRNWWSGGRCAAAVLLLLLVHINGVYTVAFLILLLGIEIASRGWSNGRKFLWESRTLWIPLVGTAVIIAVAYWRLLPDIAKVARQWGTAPPPTSMGYLPQLFSLYMGAGYLAFVVAPLLLAGVWSGTQARRPLLLLCLAIILGPVLMSLQGVSVYPNEPRYLIFSLPLLLILLAEGIDWLARHVRMRRGAAVIAWGLTALIVLGWTPVVLRAQSTAKWHLVYVRVAKFLHAELRKGDVVVARWGDGFTLSQFFRNANTLILMPDKYLTKFASQLDTPTGGRVFYVTSPGGLKNRKARVQDFGQLEVATYSGDTARALLQEWREDLLLRTAGRVAAPFSNDYQLLALMEELLPSGQSPDHWRCLAERCAAPGATQRSLHPPLLFP
jgi:uncharacterized membrane protein